MSERERNSCAAEPRAWIRDARVEDSRMHAPDELFRARSPLLLTHLARRDGRRDCSLSGSLLLALPICSKFFQGCVNVSFTLHYSDIHWLTKMGLRHLLLTD